MKKRGKVGKKIKKWKKNKKREECTVDCNPQCIECGWTMNHPHPLAYYLMCMCAC
jgi:hypothetical protein